MPIIRIEFSLEEEKEYDLRGGDRWLRGMLLDGVKDRLMNSIEGPLEEWLAQKCEYEVNSKVNGSAMYGAYSAWCDGIGEVPMKHKAFTRALCRYDRSPRIHHGRASYGTIYIGIKMKEQATPVKPSPEDDLI